GRAAPEAADPCEDHGGLIVVGSYSYSYSYSYSNGFRVRVGVRVRVRSVRRSPTPMPIPSFTPDWRPARQPLAAVSNSVGRAKTRRELWQPRSFVEAPALDSKQRTPLPTPGEILLINPFYAKDPHASFGKHVLTPTLALTSIAGATPPGWHVRYWDENLLQGPPPWKPFPEVVGITVHLTLAALPYQ